MRKLESAQWPAFHNNGNSYTTEFVAGRWQCPLCGKSTPRVRQHLASHKDLIDNWAAAEAYCGEVALLKRREAEKERNRKRAGDPNRKETLKKAMRKYAKTDGGKKVIVEAHISSVQSVDKYEERLHSNPLLEHIRDQGALDPQYTAVVQAIQQKQTKNWVLNSSDNPCREYASMWDRLGTLDTRDPTLLTLDIKRLVIPLEARKKILEVLHYSHQGINKTYTAARTRYY